LSNSVSPKFHMRLLRTLRKNIWKSKVPKKSLKNYMMQVFMKIAWTKRFIRLIKKTNKTLLHISLNFRLEPNELRSIILNFRREWKFIISKNLKIIVHLQIYHRAKTKVWRKYTVRLNSLNQLSFQNLKQSKRRASGKCLIGSKLSHCKRLISIQTAKLQAQEDTVLKFFSFNQILSTMTVCLRQLRKDWIFIPKARKHFSRSKIQRGKIQTLKNRL
jgi:hypothetical protein